MRQSATDGPAASSFSRTRSQTDHLLRRAGFGARPIDVLSATRDGLATTIDRLVDYEQTAATLAAPPASAVGPRDYTGFDLASWWVQAMIATPRPLQEKMVLFWHGHFATGISKVGNAAWMYRQNQLFRDLALPRFDDLLSAVYKDPAMLRWLDGDRNTAQAPNENWGREVMELFTLGHGNYTEDDVHANSRAFTGWRIGLNGQAIFVPRLHDNGSKTLLGHTGNWNGEDAVRILSAHPATGPFLAGKLWRFFASDTPPAGVIEKLGKIYYNSDHSIREMVRAIFHLPEFYSPTTRAGHIKSPVEFVITPVRQLGLTGIDTTRVPRTLQLLGQQLFNPPNVGGWPAGPTWINAATMLGRFNFASLLTGDAAPKLAQLTDTSAILTASRAQTMSDLVTYILGMLGITPSRTTYSALLHYAGTGSIADATADVTIRGVIHLALISPEYQAS